MTTSETSSASRTTGLAFAGALASVLVTGLLFASSSPTPPASAAISAPGSKAPSPQVQPQVESDFLKPVRSSTSREHTVKRLLEELEARIALSGKKWRAKENNWMDLQLEASSLLVKTRLTGDLDLLTLAEQRLAEAFKRAPPGGGPWLAQAKLKLTLHKLVEAEAALKGFDTSIVKSRPRASAAAAIRGDIALQRGDYNAAAAHLKRAVDYLPQASSTARVRLASIHEQMGEKDQAAALLDQLVAQPGPKEGLNRAWMLLRRGIFELDRGEMATALTWFKQADKALPGWYVVEEHQAECLTALGQLDQAEAIYLKVLAKNPSPEFEAAIADVFEAQGRTAEAAARRQKADQGFRQKLKDHPEAMAGHALDWFLESDDAEKAVTVAEANYQLRPSGAAKTKLAMAFVRAGQNAEATKLLNELREGVFRSADLYAVDAYLLRQQGDTAGADSVMQQAERLRRGASEDYAWLKPVEP